MVGGDDLGGIGPFGRLGHGVSGIYSLPIF